MDTEQLAREREWNFILEKEVEQQLQMEALVKKYAIVNGDSIIFLFDQMGPIVNP
jgi:hypothetical protein